MLFPLEIIEMIALNNVHIFLLLVRTSKKIRQYLLKKKRKFSSISIDKPLFQYRKICVIRRGRVNSNTFGVTLGTNDYIYFNKNIVRYTYKTKILLDSFPKIKKLFTEVMKGKSNEITKKHRSLFDWLFEILTDGVSINPKHM